MTCSNGPNAPPARTSGHTHHRRSRRPSPPTADRWMRDDDTARTSAPSRPRTSRRGPLRTTGRPAARAVREVGSGHTRLPRSAVVPTGCPAHRPARTREPAGIRERARSRVGRFLRGLRRWRYETATAPRQIGCTPGSFCEQERKAAGLHRTDPGTGDASGRRRDRTMRSPAITVPVPARAARRGR